MIQVTVRYGMAKRETTVAEGTTIARILSDANNKAVLGYGDNVQAVVFGSVQELGTKVEDGMTIEVEAKANEKAIVAA
jgi:hypothetical protein